MIGYGMANIFDIAREAGVSRSTVSRVINNQPNVKYEKRIKVKEAIKRLNFTPNAAARMLALKKTYTIGVVVKELGDVFYASFIHNIHYIADSYGYGAFYCNRNSTIQSEVNYLERLNKQVDGYIFIGEKTVSKEELEVLARSGEIVITIGFDLGVENVTTITIDNYEATYGAVEKLIEQGHRNIVYINAEEETVESSLRQSAYEDVINKYELNYSRVERIDYLSDSAYNLGMELADDLKKEKVTAIICFNDTLATGLTDGLITKGVSVPEDISVVGFDDVAVRRITSNNLPALTTISQPQQRMAEFAVRHFIKRVDDDQHHYHEKFKCVYVERESTKKSL
jgi:DNA-binding LacI/PurR family transcriptional regulator